MFHSCAEGGVGRFQRGAFCEELRPAFLCALFPLPDFCRIPFFVELLDPEIQSYWQNVLIKELIDTLSFMHGKKFDDP